MSDGYERVPVRTIRVPDEEWRAAQEAARQRGESVSEAVRTFLKRYVRSAPPSEREARS